MLSNRFTHSHQHVIDAHYCTIFHMVSTIPRHSPGSKSGSLAEPDRGLSHSDRGTGNLVQSWRQDQAVPAELLLLLANLTFKLLLSLWRWRRDRPGPGNPCRQSLLPWVWVMGWQPMQIAGQWVLSPSSSCRSWYYFLIFLSLLIKSHGAATCLESNLVVQTLAKKRHCRRPTLNRRTARLPQGKHNNRGQWKPNFEIELIPLDSSCSIAAARFKWFLMM